MSRRQGWTSRIFRSAVVVIGLSAVVAPSIAAGTASASTTRSVATRVASPAVLVSHRSLTSDLCTFAKIDNEVRAFPKMKSAPCTDVPPKSDGGCLVSEGRWVTTKGGLGVLIEVYSRCTRSMMNSVEGDLQTEDRNSQYGDSSLDIGKWSVGYWNLQYGQGELASESRSILVVLDVTDPYIKIGQSNGYTPAPPTVALLKTIMSFA